MCQVVQRALGSSDRGLQVARRGFANHTSTVAPPSGGGGGGGGGGTCGGGGSCVSAWAPNQAYTAGNEVSYNGANWTANQWNYDEVPGGPSGAWNNDGSC